MVEYWVGSGGDEKGRWMMDNGERNTEDGERK